MMATTFQFTVTPDVSLGIDPIALTVSLTDPTDFQALMGAYTDLLHLGDTPTPTQIITAWVSSLMQGTLINVQTWAKDKKLAQVEVTVPTLTITNK
jgi:hypothetical protein